MNLAIFGTNFSKDEGRLEKKRIKDYKSGHAENEEFGQKLNYARTPISRHCTMPHPPACQMPLATSPINQFQYPLDPSQISRQDYDHDTPRDHNQKGVCNMAHFSSVIVPSHCTRQSTLCTLTKLYVRVRF